MSAREVIQNPEEKWHIILESSPEAITTTDLTGTIVEANPKTLRMHGYESINDMIGKNAFDLIAPRDHNRARENMQLCFKQGTLHNILYTMVRKDGSEFLGELSSSVLRDASGIPIGFMAITRDITERKAAEESLKQSEEKYRSLFDNMTEAFILMEPILDTKGKPCNYRILEVNNAWKKLYALPGEEVLNKTALNLFPDISLTWLENAAEVALTGKPRHIEYFNQLFNIWLEIYFYSPKPGYIANISLDITERKQTAEALAKARDGLETEVNERTADLVKISEELQLKATILDKATDAILLRGIDNIIVYANEAAGKIHGYGKDELIDINFRSLVSPQELPNFEERFKALVNEREIRAEAYNLRKDKSLFPVEVHSHLIKIGQRQFILSVIRDFTKRKRAEEKLKQSESSLRLILKQIPCVLWTMDKKLRFTSVTGAGLKDSNLTPDQILGMTLTDYVKDDNPENVAIKAHLNALSGIASNFEINEQDTGRTFLAYVEPLHDTEASITGIIGVSLDITEQKVLRDEKELFTRRLIEVQEEERKRISRDLHDEAAQYLALLTLEIDNLIVKGEKLSPEGSPNLKKLKGIAEIALQEIRRYSHELRPSVLEHFGLPEALELIIGEFNERSNIQVGFKVSGEETRLKEVVELTFFRIAQEALSNIRKHSEATKAEVSLRYLPNKVRLTIADKGRGFDVAKKRISSTQGGLGLVGMRERANLIGGTLKISSKIGKGTTISVEVRNKDNYIN